MVLLKTHGVETLVLIKSVGAQSPEVGSLEKRCQLRCYSRHLTEVQNYEIGGENFFLNYFNITRRFSCAGKSKIPKKGNFHDLKNGGLPAIYRKRDGRRCHIWSCCCCDFILHVHITTTYNTNN
ncbi:hypothetical protein TNCV_212321 [Trichonephila clavipes]|nr:hypothetical protein TNCV_212321 [Trichonephila clavipes]